MHEGASTFLPFSFWPRFKFATAGSPDSWIARLLDVPKFLNEFGPRLARRVPSQLLFNWTPVCWKPTFQIIVIYWVPSIRLDQCSGSILRPEALYFPVCQRVYLRLSFHCAWSCSELEVRHMIYWFEKPFHSINRSYAVMASCNAWWLLLAVLHCIHDLLQQWKIVLECWVLVEW